MYNVKFAQAIYDADDIKKKVFNKNHSHNAPQAGA